jgi:hypothetical protein
MSALMVIGRLDRRETNGCAVPERSLLDGLTSTMTNKFDETLPLHEPLAELERELISAYVAGAGHDLQELLTRTDDDAKRLLAEASRYASAKLSEIESRSHYLHRLHGEP